MVYCIYNISAKTALGTEAAGTVRQPENTAVRREE